MGQQTAAQAVCCEPDNYEKSKRAEINFSSGGYPDCLPEMRSEHCIPEMDSFHPPGAEVFLDPAECLRCSSREDPTDGLFDNTVSLESLTYTQVRFDAKATIDPERSQNRYSRIVMHGARARTQRRSKAWEEWLRAAAAGRAVTMLVGTGFQSFSGAEKSEGCQATQPPNKVQAMYYLDRELTKLSILPQDKESSESAMVPITILVENIQVICPLTDFMLLSETAEAQLDESERARAALLQFKTEASDASQPEQRRVCFLEESEDAKERFVQALTALWLEKRSDHSMWF